MNTYYYIQKNGMAFSSKIELEISLEEKNKNFQINSFLENEEFIISNKLAAHIKLEQNDNNNSIIGFIGNNYIDFYSEGFSISFKDNKFLEIELPNLSYSYSSLLFMATKNQQYKEKTDKKVHIIFHDGSKLFLENVLFVEKKDNDCYIIITNCYTYHICQISLFIHYSDRMEGQLSLNIIYLNNHICIPYIKRNYLKIERDKLNEILILRNTLIENPFIDFVYLKGFLSTVFYTKENPIHVLSNKEKIRIIHI